MRWWLLMVVVFSMSGCIPDKPPPPPPPPPPKPIVKVEREESNESVKVTVRYLNHRRYSNEEFYNTIETPEELNRYRKELQFALDQLDDASTRMQVHEQTEKIELGEE